MGTLDVWAKARTYPRGNGNSESKNEKQIPFGDDNKKGNGKGSGEKQITFAGDN